MRQKKTFCLVGGKEEAAAGQGQKKAPSGKARRDLLIMPQPTVKGKSQKFCATSSALRAC
jgi:hypothetical protein